MKISEKKQKNVSFEKFFENLSIKGFFCEVPYRTFPFKKETIIKTNFVITLQNEVYHTKIYSHVTFFCTI
jgi:hypothetical protein